MKRFNLMVASTAGTTLEWYDFFTFAACSVLVFDKSFFAGVADPFVATLLSLGTFSVGFLARPVGGILFGIAGDRVGRKKMLVISLLMMGVGTVAIGCLPTYQSIGAWAPVMLIVLRIAQGIAVGGEASGAILIVAESMPAGHRGFWTSFSMFSGPLANVLTAVVITSVQRHYGDAAFAAWAWRIPFLISVVLIVVGFWTRRQIEESPVFKAAAEATRGLPKAGLREAVRDHFPAMATAFFVKAAENTYLYIFSTFLLLLATTYLKLSRADALSALLWGSALEVVVTMVAAAVSDRIGRRPVLLFGFLAATAASYGLFTLPPGASYNSLLVAVMICLTCHGIIIGGMAAFMTELFPTRVRYTAVSTSYQLASVAGGSVAPLIGATLLHFTGSAITVAFYATAVAIPALIAVWRAQESRGVDLAAIGPSSAVLARTGLATTAYSA